MKKKRENAKVSARESNKSTCEWWNMYSFWNLLYFYAY